MNNSTNRTHKFYNPLVLQVLQLTSPNLKFFEGFNFQWDPLVIQLTCHIQLEFFLTTQPTVPFEVHYAYEKRSSIAMRHYL